MIMTKLPQDLHLCIAREADKEIWELMTVIKREVEAREAAEFVKLHQPVIASESSISLSISSVEHNATISSSKLLICFIFPSNCSWMILYS